MLCDIFGYIEVFWIVGVLKDNDLHHIAGC